LTQELSLSSRNQELMQMIINEDELPSLVSELELLEENMTLKI